MLVTLGLSPALQRVMVFERYVPGRVNRAARTLSCAAGKSINAARAARIYSPGLEITVVAPLGGAAGEVCRRDLRRMEMDEPEAKGAPDTRTCTTVIDQATGEVTELVEESPKLDGKLVEGVQWVLGSPKVLLCAGSLSPGAPEDFYAVAAGRCRAETLVVDAKGNSLLAAMGVKECANRVAKLNAEEALETTGAADLPGAIRALHAAGATRVIITDGACEVHASDGKYRTSYQPPKVKVVNTTGCGDCLTGVFAAALLSGRDFYSAVKDGIAASAASAETLLPSEYSPKRAAELAL